MGKRKGKHVQSRNSRIFFGGTPAILLTATLILFTVVLDVLIPSRENNKYSEYVVAWVNGEPVTIDEYIRAMHRSRSSVVSSFLVRGRCQSEPDFWNIPTDGETPLEALRQAALDSLTETKVILALAREGGFIGDVSQEAILANLEDENIRRAEAVAAGQVIYGPQQFTEDVYLDLVIADIRAMLRVNAEETANFTEEELMENFERYWAGQINNPGVYSIRKIHVSFAYSHEASARSNANAILGRIQEGADFDGPWNYAEVIDQYLSGMRGMGHQDQAPSLSALQDLEIGDISDVYRDEGGYSILKFVDLFDVTYHTFAESRFSISNAMAGRAFEEYLQNRIGQATVSVNSDLFERINEDGVIATS